jgi:hypothetical protein
MPLFKMTRELAGAAGMDAGNRSMRAAGRTAWNDDDLEAARVELMRVYPYCPHGCWPENCILCCETA